MDKPRIYKVQFEDGETSWVCRTEKFWASAPSPRRAYEDWRKNAEGREERIAGHKRQFAILDTIAAIYKRIGADGRKNG